MLVAPRLAWALYALLILHAVPTSAIKNHATLRGRSSFRAIRRALVRDSNTATLPEGGGPASQEELQEKLSRMGLAKLVKRAEDEGIDSDALDKAMEGSEPKKSVIALLVEKHKVDSPDQLKSELSALRLMELVKRAEKDDVNDAALDKAMDSKNPKAALIALVVAKHESGANLEEKLTAELEKLSLRKLLERAEKDDVSDDALGDAMESNNPKNEVIAQIVEKKTEAGTKESTGAVSPRGQSPLGQGAAGNNAAPQRMADRPPLRKARRRRRKEPLSLKRKPPS